MADTYRVITTRATVQLLGQVDTQDVIEVWYESQPSHVQFKVYIPDNQFTEELVAYHGEHDSPLFELARNFHGVEALYPRQDVDASGDLVDKHVFGLVSDNGAVHEDFVVPTYAIVIFYGLEEQVAAEVAKLNGIAGL